MLNSIGQFVFLMLSPAPEIIRRELAVIARQGVDGIALMRTGIRGRPFTVRTGVDAENAIDAQAALANYQGLIGADPVNVVYAGLDYAAYGCVYAVRDIRPFPVKGMLGAAGGLFPPSFAWVEAEWTLIPISLEPGEE